MTDVPGLRSREEMTTRYRQLRRERGQSGHARWLLLIKVLRARDGVSILEAERIALANPHRRRWVESRINSDQACRKRALAHIRYNGADAVIERLGEGFEFRVLEF